ncbi:MAG: flagellar hook-length control protein FliK [Alkalispirochaetaceae bacterium]
MREVAFIDGIIRSGPSDNRRFESPQLPTGPSFSDLLSQVEASRFNSTAYSRIDTSPQTPPESDAPQRARHAERSDRREFSIDERSDRRSEETREGSDADRSDAHRSDADRAESDRAAREGRERDDAARENAAREERARDGERRSAEERVSREREEANQRRAEEAEKPTARDRGDAATGKDELPHGEAVTGAEKKGSDTAEGEEAEALAKLAVGEAISKLTKGEEAPTKEAEWGRRGEPQSEGARLVELAREQGRGRSRRSGAEASDAEASGADKNGEDASSTEREKMEKALAQTRNRSRDSAAEEGHGPRERAVATELSGSKALLREFSQASSGTEPVSDEIRRKAEKALSDLESRERSEGDDRKLRVVDLRAPREARRPREAGSEQNSDGTGRNGLKESGQLRSFEGSESNTPRFEGGESVFARQLGSPSRGEGVAQRFVQQQQELHRFLQEKGYGEIVRNARVMLREGGNGELRLNLSPKELGSVRVQLQLQDSHIAGRIIVENSTVREVFEQNLEQLQRAFQSQGLDTGRLEVAVEQRGDGRERRGRGETGRGEEVRIFEEHTARLPDSFYEDARVNLMA